MALPTSGPISASMIRAEFEQTGAMSLSSYYRGGGIVPDIPQNSNVPAGGTISYSNFYGASNQVLTPWSPTTIIVESFDTSASFSIATSGFVNRAGTQLTPSTPITWHIDAPLGAGDSNDFFVRVQASLDPIGNHAGSDLIDTWLQLNQNRTWVLTATTAFEPSSSSYTVFINTAPTNSGQTFMGEVVLISTISGFS